MFHSCLIRVVLATDENYDKMYAIYKACNDADVSYPQEVVDYFDSAINGDDDYKIGESGIIKYIAAECVSDEDCCEKIYNISLDDLPANTKAIQVEPLSW